MSATKRSISRTCAGRFRQAGRAAIEFALLAFVFFTVVFGAFEVARIMYVFNTVQESTRRAAHAASLGNFRDTDALASIRRQAVLRSTPGFLPFGEPISDQSIRIDYMALVREGSDLVRREIPEGSLPVCARENRRICMNNPNADNCIRFVRARICQAGNGCDPVRYVPVIPLISIPVNIPRSTTIAVVESFGSMPEGTPCL